MPTSPGPLLQALNALWERLREGVPDLPPVRPAVSPTPLRLDHGPERWKLEEDGAVSGFVVSADVLQAGAERTVELTLHEAAHILCWRRGIKDTTMRGVYHNQNFLAAAEEVCLVWPADAERVQGRGYRDPVLSDEGRERFAADIAALAEVIPGALPHLEVPPPVTSTRVDRLTLQCKCDPPRRFRISQTVAAKGPIICGVCNERFTVE
ncbi:hypothetical protein [Streptomyces sp. NPDC060001]|uniref:hypothetical protein n=1 Tax=Streptomyces sp. NPDC060001 TaxID=3347032 RepID=UPI0036A432C8